MEEHEWIPKPKPKSKKIPADEETLAQDNVVKEPTEDSPHVEPLEMIRKAGDLEGEPLNASKTFAVLALVDIAEKVKRLRKVPRFSHISHPVSVIGTERTADIKVNDLETVRPKHAALVFKGGCFSLHPLEGSVCLNGHAVGSEGEVLSNGARIEIGSAKFVFLVTG